MELENNSWRKALNKMVEKIKMPVCALIFIEAGFINIIVNVFVYIIPSVNINFLEAIKYLFYAILFMIVFILAILQWKQRYNSRSKIIIILGIILLTIPELYNCIVCGFELDAMIYLIKYGVFVLPYFFIAIISFDKKGELDLSFIKWFKWIGAIFVPFFVFYIVSVYTDFGLSSIDFGSMTYMDLAYFATVILIGSVLDFLFFSKSNIHKYVSIFVSIIALFFIVCTGTRSAILVTLGFAMLLFIIRGLRHDNLRTTIAVVLVIIAIDIFVLFVFPPQDGRLTENKFFYETTEKITISKEAIMETAEKGKEEIPLMSRPMLFKIAYKEFLNSPIIGHGFYYYINKYGTYPHNAILEIMCDAGVVGTVIFVIIVLSIFVLLLKEKENINNAIIILFSLSYTAAYMVSGSVYQQTLITFYITCGILIVVNTYERKQMLAL